MADASDPPIDVPAGTPGPLPFLLQPDQNVRLPLGLNPNPLPPVLQAPRTGNVLPPQLGPRPGAISLPPGPNWQRDPNTGEWHFEGMSGQPTPGPYAPGPPPGTPNIQRTLIGLEGGAQYRTNPINTSSGHAQSWFQITTGTWQEFAPRAGVNLQQYPTPESAPFNVQQQVAQTIPLGRWSTFPSLSRQYPGLNPNMTLGEATQYYNGSQRLMPPIPRQPSEWGKPPNMNGPPGTMPTFNDIPGIMQGLQRLMGMSSLGGANTLAIALTAYGAMVRARTNGQLLEQQYQNTLWQNALKEHNARAEMELGDLGQTLAEFGTVDAKGVYTPTSGDTEALRQRILELAFQYSDKQLQALAENGDFSGIQRLATTRDMLGQSALKLQETQAHINEMNAQAAKATAEAEKAKQDGGTGLLPEDAPGMAAPAAGESGAGGDQSGGVSGSGVTTQPPAPSAAPASTPPPDQTTPPQPPAAQPSPPNTAPAAPPAPQQQGEATPPAPTEAPYQTASLVPTAPAHAVSSVNSTPAPLPAVPPLPPAPRPVAGSTPEVPGLPAYSSTPNNRANMATAQISDTRLDQDARRYMRTGHDQYTRFAVAGEARNELVRRRAAQIQSSFDKVLADARQARMDGHPWNPEEVLQHLMQFDPGIAGHAREIANGDMPMLTSAWAANSQYWSNMWEIMPQINPAFSGGFYTRKQNWLNNLGTGSNGVSRMAMNTVMSHLALLRDSISRLPQGSYPSLNAIQVALSKQGGSSAVTNFDELFGHVSQEATRVFRGTGGNVSDIQRELGNISAASSPAQKLGFIRTLADLLYERLSSIAYTGEMQANIAADPMSLMSPQAQAIYLQLHNIPQTGDMRDVQDPLGIGAGTTANFGSAQSPLNLTYQGGGVWSDPKTGTAYITQPGATPGINNAKSWNVGPPIEGVPFQELPTIPPPPPQTDPQSGWQYN